MSILVKSQKFSFNRKDFRNVQISGADLSNGVFFKTNFSGTDLKNCKTTCTQFLDVISNNISSIENLQINTEPIEIINSIAFSHDEKHLAVCKDNSIQIWNNLSKTIVNTLQNQPQSIGFKCSSWSFDDKYVITNGNCEGEILMWEPFDDLIVMKKMPSDVSIIQYALNSPVDDKIALYSVNNELIIWINSSNQIKVHIPKSNLETISWSPSGSYIAYITENKTLSTWDLKDDSSYDICNAEINSSDWISNDCDLAFATFDTIYIRNLLTGFERTLSFQGQPSIQAIKWAKKYELLIIGSFDGSIAAWSLKDLKSAHPTKNIEFFFSGHSKGITSLSWATKNELFASGSLDGTVKVWKIARNPDPDHTETCSEESKSEESKSEESKSEGSSSSSGQVEFTEHLVWASQAPHLIIADSSINL